MSRVWLQAFSPMGSTDRETGSIAVAVFVAQQMQMFSWKCRILSSVSVWEEGRDHTGCEGRTRRQIISE